MTKISVPDDLLEQDAQVVGWTVSAHRTALNEMRSIQPESGIGWSVGCNAHRCVAVHELPEADTYNVFFYQPNSEPIWPLLASFRVKKDERKNLLSVSWIASSEAETVLKCDQSVLRADAVDTKIRSFAATCVSRYLSEYPKPPQVPSPALPKGPWPKLGVGDDTKLRTAVDPTVDLLAFIGECTTEADLKAKRRAVRLKIKHSNDGGQGQLVTYRQTSNWAMRSVLDETDPMGDRQTHSRGSEYQHVINSVCQDAIMSMGS